MFLRSFFLKRRFSFCIRFLCIFELLYQQFIHTYSIERRTWTTISTWLSTHIWKYVSFKPFSSLQKSNIGYLRDQTQNILLNEYVDTYKNTCPQKFKVYEADELYMYYHFSISICSYPVPLYNEMNYTPLYQIKAKPKPFNLAIDAYLKWIAFIKEEWIDSRILLIWCAQQAYLVIIVPTLWQNDYSN